MLGFEVDHLDGRLVALEQRLTGLVLGHLATVASEQGDLLGSCPAVLVKLPDLRTCAVVVRDVRARNELPMVLPRHLALRIAHRRPDVEQVGVAGVVERVISADGLRAGEELRVDLAHGGDLPVLPAAPGLDHVGASEHRLQLLRVLERDGAVGLGVVDLGRGNAYLGAGRTLRHRGARPPEACGRAKTGILVGAVQDEELLVGQNDAGRVPALILHVGGMLRVGVVLVAGIGMLFGMLALRVGQEIHLDLRHIAVEPGLAHRIEDVDLADAVVAALVVAADEGPTAIGERDVPSAEDVVVQPLRVSGCGDRVFGQSDVRFGDQRLAVRVEDTELTSILEGIGMRQVPADEVLALDRAVRDALIQAVRPGAEAVAAVHELLEDVLQLAVFVHQVVADVFGRTHAEADLGLRVRRPGQAHVDCILGQRDQRAQLPDFGGITLLGVGCSGGQCDLELAANTSAKCTVAFLLIAPSMVD